MKKLLTFILLLSPCFMHAQINHPEHFKYKQIKEYNTIKEFYYNPFLDNYDVYFVKLDLEVSDKSKYISGNATLQATSTEKLDTLIFDFSNYMTVDSVFINDKKVDYLHQNDIIQYVFESPLNVRENIKTQIFYHGMPSATGRGVNNDYSINWDKSVTWTLSESFHAYEWWPCNQVLSDKIDSAYIFLTCDNNCKAGSNGLLTNEVDLPNNKKRFEWKTFYPINYYLISFAVSEYQEYINYAYPSGSEPILIQNYIYNTPGCLDYYKSQIDETPNMIEFYSSIFGLYPFANEKYGHCLTTLGGGMEHQTMTTLGDFSYLLVAHELAHMWFGDYVTCATWQDIWINEGFASYSEYIILENLQSYIAAKEWLNIAHDYALREPEGSVYIPFEQAFSESRIFNYYLSYKKGASILHTLRHEINNDDLFFSAIRTYLNIYADSVATGDDFKLVMARETGLDLNPFFNQWYYGKGYPQFDVEYYQQNDTLYITTTESTSSSDTPLFQVHVDYKLIFSDSDTSIRLFQSKNSETYKIPVSKSVRNVLVDPENWILKSPGNVKRMQQIVEEKLFKVQPNLTHDYIQILFHNQFADKEKIIGVFDLHGRLIKTYKTNGLQLPVNLSYLSSGYYFVQITCQDKKETHKIIKQ